MATDLERVVDRFADRLRREGYRVGYGYTRDFYVLTAYGHEGRAVARYVARLKEGRVYIEDVRDGPPAGATAFSGHRGRGGRGRGRLLFGRAVTP